MTKQIYFLLIISFNLQAQKTIIRPLEGEIYHWHDLYHRHYINAKNVISVTYSNQGNYNKTTGEFEEINGYYIDFYKNSTYFFDSKGRVKKRIIYDQGKNKKGVENYYYTEKDNIKELFVQRLTEDKKDKTKRIDLNLKEKYKNGKIIERYTAQFKFEYYYDKNFNLIKILEKEFEEVHKFDSKGSVTNFSNNKAINSNTLFTYKYNDKNQRVEKKEINNNTFTYITKYTYNKKGNLVNKLICTYIKGSLKEMEGYRFEYDNFNNYTQRKKFNDIILDENKNSDQENIRRMIAIMDSNDLYNEHKTFHYKYDTNGNWTSKILGDFYSDDKIKLKRIIKYK